MKRILVMAISFGLALGVADLVTLILWWPPIEEAPYAAILILLYIAIFAVLPGLAFVTLSEIHGCPGWLGHMVAGAGVAVLANIIFFIVTAHGFPSQTYFWPDPKALLSGAAGGLAYWGLAVASWNLRTLNPFRPETTPIGTAGFPFRSTQN